MSHHGPHGMGAHLLFRRLYVKALLVKVLGGGVLVQDSTFLSAEVAEVGKSEPKMWSTLAMFEESRLPFKVSSLTS